MKKKLVITALVITTLAASAVGAQNALATSTPTTQNSLVQMIANKFGLKTSDVQGVFDQYKQQHTAKMQQNYQTRLDQLVKDGKLTSDQEKLIQGEHQKLQSEHQSDFTNFKNLTPEQCKDVLSKIRQEVTDWSKTNNIPARYLMPGPGMGRMHMFFGSSADN